LGMLRIAIRSWRHAQRLYDLWQQIDSKIGIEDQKRLTRDTQRQLHARKDGQPPLRSQRVSDIVRLQFGGLLEVFEEAQVVMIRDGDRIEAPGAADGNEFLRVLAAFSLRDRASTLPVKVARRMHLKIALVEVGAFIHK
jgi:hypothetical protein